MISLLVAMLFLMILMPLEFFLIRMALKIGMIYLMIVLISKVLRLSKKDYN